MIINFGASFWAHSLEGFLVDIVIQIIEIIF